MPRRSTSVLSTGCADGALHAFVQAAVHRPDVLEELPADRRQRHGPVVAFEQGGADTALLLLDRLADAGGCHVQPLGGPAEVQFLGLWCSKVGKNGYEPAMAKVKPMLTPLAAAGLALTMILAAGFHIVRGEYALVPATLLLGGVAAFITAGRWKLRPIAPANITTSRARGSIAVLVAVALLTFVPTWYTMTHVQF